MSTFSIVMMYDSFDVYCKLDDVFDKPSPCLTIVHVHPFRDKYNLIHQLDESLNSTICYPKNALLPNPSLKKHQFKK